MGFGFEDHDDFMDFMFSHAFMHSFSFNHGRVLDELWVLVLKTTTTLWILCFLTHSCIHSHSFME